jgi:DNA mismatch repair protein MutS2
LGVCDYEPDGLAQLDFPRVLEKIAAMAQTAMGRERIIHRRFLASPEALQAAHRAVREGLRFLSLEFEGLGDIVPLGPLVVRAEKGGRLSGMELAAIGRALRSYRDVDRRVVASEFPQLRRQLITVTLPEALLGALERALSDAGDVLDQASPKLGALRARRRRLEEDLDALYQQLVHSPKWAPYLQEPIVTRRFGRRVLPVRHEYRNRVAGIVQDVSASGQTVFVEPLPAVTLQNQWTAIQAEEAEEVDRILAALSQQVAEHTAALVDIERALGELDEVLAIARYGVATDSILPEIGGDELLLVRARHPLLPSPVPLDVRLTSSQPALVITGPNTGGKTVALKTIGVLAAMARSGLMVPAGEGTKVPWFDCIWADIGDEQSLEQNLSTFSSHMRRIIPMVRQASPHSLCLIDEIGAGTDPDEGAALAEAVLQRLVERGTMTVVSTHFSRLKFVALSDPRIHNASVEFDPQSFRPTYRLIMGQPGSSYAFEVADRLGLPQDVIEHGRRLLDPLVRTLSQALEEVEKIRQGVDVERQRVEQAHHDVEQMRARMEQERVEWRARQEREYRAFVESWRQQLDSMRRQFQELLDAYRRAESEDRARALEKVRAQLQAFERLPDTWARQSVAPAVDPPNQVGDAVRIQGFSEPGVVLEIQGKTATVQMGSLKLKMQVKDLERVGRGGSGTRSGGQSARVGREKARQMNTECDLRGLTQADALAVLDKVLDDASLADVPWVRIIHGKGTGTLRRAVADALRRDRRVVRYRLGERGEGGDGVTIAYLQEVDAPTG